jgi:hypothetical protein
MLAVVVVVVVVSLVVVVGRRRVVVSGAVVVVLSSIVLNVENCWSVDVEILASATTLSVTVGTMKISDVGFGLGRGARVVST